MGSSFLLIIVLSIAYSTGVVRQLVDNVFYFALTVKNDRLPFIVTSVLFIPFFLLVVGFIRKLNLKKIGIAFVLFLLFFFLYILIAPTRIVYLTSFYKESTIYYFILFFIVPLAAIALLFKSKDKAKKEIVMTSIEAFSLFLASAFSGRDYATVIVAAPLYIPLFIYLFNAKYKSFKLPKNKTLVILFLIIFTFPSITSLAKTYKSIYGNEQSYNISNIKNAKYINISISQKNDLETTVSYIKNEVPQGNKLLCIPYCSFMNYLTERRNASYFGFFYKFNPQDQQKVIRDIHENKDSIVLIQNQNIIEEEANYEDGNINLLKKFIYKNYEPVKITENFSVYKNKL